MGYNVKTVYGILHFFLYLKSSSYKIVYPKEKMKCHGPRHDQILGSIQLL